MADDLSQDRRICWLGLKGEEEQTSQGSNINRNTKKKDGRGCSCEEVGTGGRRWWKESWFMSLVVLKSPTNNSCEIFLTFFKSHLTCDWWHWHCWQEHWGWPHLHTDAKPIKQPRLSHRNLLSSSKLFIFTKKKEKNDEVYACVVLLGVKMM